MRKNLGQRSYPNDRNHHLPPVRGVAVLKEKDPLPSTQCHTTSDDRDGLTGAGHRHAQVAAGTLALTIGHRDLLALPGPGLST